MWPSMGIWCEQHTRRCQRGVRVPAMPGSSVHCSSELVSYNLKGQKPSIIFLWGFSLLMTVLTDPVLFIHWNLCLYSVWDAHLSANLCQQNYKPVRDTILVVTYIGCKKQMQMFRQLLMCNENSTFQQIMLPNKILTLLIFKTMNLYHLLWIVLSFLERLYFIYYLKKIAGISDTFRMWLNRGVPNNLPEAFCKAVLKFNTVDWIQPYNSYLP